MDTTASLEQVAETTKSRTVAAKVDQVPLLMFEASEMAQSYCRNIMDKFPGAPQGLVQRLGEANCERHKRIREQLEYPCNLEEVRTQLEVDEVEDDCKQTDAGRDTLFHDSGLGTSIAAPSTLLAVPPTSTFLNRRPAKAPSTATFTSFLTDDTSHGGRMPPMPYDAHTGKPFKCNICGQIIRNVTTRVDWKYVNST